MPFLFYLVKRFLGVILSCSIDFLVIKGAFLKGLAEITKCAENLNAYFRQKYEIVERELD